VKTCPQPRFLNPENMPVCSLLGRLILPSYFLSCFTFGCYFMTISLDLNLQYVVTDFLQLIAFLLLYACYLIVLIDIVAERGICHLPFTPESNPIIAIRNTRWMDSLRLPTHDGIYYWRVTFVPSCLPHCRSPISPNRSYSRPYFLKPKPAHDTPVGP